MDRALAISNELSAPFAYVNRVASEDEILFDGMSFIVDGTNITAQAKSFQDQVITVPLPKFAKGSKNKSTKISNSWQNLFTPNVRPDTKSLNPLTDNELEKILEALIFSISEYARKNNMNKFLVALSGGIDSSLVLVILSLMKRTIAVEVEALFMP